MIKKLVEAGVHFGHLVSRWCPKMEPYIWGQRNKIHLIDVSKTARQIDKAAAFLESVAASGKQILWIGTKKAAQDIIAKSAQSVNMPFVNHRWIGGTLSNNSQVKKSVTRLMHHEDIIEKSAQVPHYTKKELNVFQKLVGRLEKNVGGIRNLRWPVGAIVIVDVKEEAAALKEATVMGIPVVALVDTNSDPSLVDYVIPANDDAARSISLVVDFLVQGVQTGLEKYKKEVERAKSEKQQKVAQGEPTAHEEAPTSGKKRAVKRDKKVAESSVEAATHAPETVVIVPPTIDDSAKLALLDDEEDFE